MNSSFFPINGTGFFYCHQGYTDIINCCALIKFYRKYYNTLFVLMRDDMKDFFDFFLNDCKNIIMIYQPKKNINNIFFNLNINNNIDTLFHGDCIDWKRINHLPLNIKSSFSENFYLKYNFNYNIRFEYFNFNRNFELEETKYNEINPNNEPYIVIHDDTNRNLNLNIYEKYKIINLNNISSIMFDTIKIIENANEIHCIDSIWSCFIYIIDMKYNYFNNIKIYFYCMRHHDFFFKPLKKNHFVVEKI